MIVVVHSTISNSEGKNLSIRQLKNRRYCIVHLLRLPTADEVALRLKPSTSMRVEDNDGEINLVGFYSGTPFTKIANTRR